MNAFKFIAGMVMVSAGVVFIYWGVVHRSYPVDQLSDSTVSSILLSILVTGMGLWSVGDSIQRKIK
jgi:hypothetical protein